MVLFHRIVNWYWDHLDDRQVPSADTIAEALGVEPRAVGGIFEEMAEGGLVNPSRGIGSGYVAHAVVTSTGRSLLREYAERPRARGLAVSACAEALLDWLYEHDGEADLVNFGTGKGDGPSFEHDVRAHYFGEPFPSGVIGAATHQLREDGLVDGRPLRSTGTVYRLRLTSAGREVIQTYSGSIRDWKQARAATSSGVTFNFGGDASGVAVAVNSPGASQSVTVTNDHRKQLIGLADAFEQMLPVLGLSPDQNEQAQTIMGELREIDPAQEPGKVKRLLKVAGELAVGGAGNAAGTGLVALIQQIAQNWPF